MSTKPIMKPTKISNYNSKTSFIAYAHIVAHSLATNGRQGTADKYTTSINSLVKYLSTCGKHDLLFGEVSSLLFESYEAHLHSHRISPNTTSFYMRNLRAIYNRAVEDKLTLQQYPFKRVYTGIENTVKRALPLHIIKAIRTINLDNDRQLDFARDMFMLAFYLRGISFVDLAYLLKTDLSNGQLTYRRRKTGQKLIIKWTAEMQAILDKYPPVNTPYLLPIITDLNKDSRREYRNASYRVNRNLKKISTLLGISNLTLTHYVARHSWASAARNNGVPLSIISQGMGHESESTTRIYLSLLDNTLVDEANESIIKALE